MQPWPTKKQPYLRRMPVARTDDPAVRAERTSNSEPLHDPKGLTGANLPR